VAFRSYNAEIGGTEQPMDLMYLNATLNSEEYPPKDPWLAGEPASYYYFGYLQSGVLTAVADVPASTGYNLSLAYTFAASAAGIGSLGFALARWMLGSRGKNWAMGAGALAVVLLSGAGLLGRSVHQLLRVDLNFDPHGLATLEVAASGDRYDDDPEVVALSRAVIGRLQAMPGVSSAGVTSLLPVSFNGNTDWIRFVGQQYNGEHNEVNLRTVSATYFETMTSFWRSSLFIARSNRGVSSPQSRFFRCAMY
jgi:uncharacterized membrane protein